METKREGGRERNNNINFQSLDWVTAAPLSTVLMTLRVVLSRSRRWRLHRRGSCQIRLFLSVRLHVTAAKIRQQRSIYKSSKIKKHLSFTSITLRSFTDTRLATQDYKSHLGPSKKSYWDYFDRYRDSRLSRISIFV